MFQLIPMSKMMTHQIVKIKKKRKKVLGAVIIHKLELTYQEIASIKSDGEFPCKMLISQDLVIFQMMASKTHHKPIFNNRTSTTTMVS